LLGEGRIWDPRKEKYCAAATVIRAYGLKVNDRVAAKEGLAMINGTQLITSLGADAVVRAKRVALQADVISALTCEALIGSSRCERVCVHVKSMTCYSHIRTNQSPHTRLLIHDTHIPRHYHHLIHDARPHKGQRIVASRMRKLLNARTKTTNTEPRSEINASHEHCGRVQDSYTLRCIPQVHGICHDTIDFVYSIIAQECNSGTDNPMVFAKAEDGKDVIISGGNFHGEYPAKALDYLAIGVHELASIAERRIERLVNPTLSRGLPAFLVKQGGLNSGFMIAHCTAAALVSENKVLCHPSSVDSLSTSAAQEDHVSMGGMSARKAIQVVRNVEYVSAIELLAACQAIDFRRPLKTTPVLEAIYTLVRGVVPTMEVDRYFTDDIEAVRLLLQQGKVWDVATEYLADLPEYPSYHFSPKGIIQSNL
jgi:histidine ammonia-lyase